MRDSYDEIYQPMLSGIKCFISIILLLFLLNNKGMDAQDRLELGGFVGTSYYMGDLNSMGHLSLIHI